jgi:hypothetical protein
MAGPMWIQVFRPKLLLLARGCCPLRVGTLWEEKERCTRRRCCYKGILQESGKCTVVVPPWKRPRRIAGWGVGGEVQGLWMGCPQCIIVPTVVLVHCLLIWVGLELGRGAAAMSASGYLHFQVTHAGNMAGWQRIASSLWAICLPKPRSVTAGDMAA